MKTYPPKPARRARHIRVPAFVPVQSGGAWTADRQAAFLGALAETRSVRAAARRVGMARETAYRLRRKDGAESFAYAWDAALGRVVPGRRRVTPDELARRALDGVLKLHFWRGRHVATVRKADNSALLRYCAQLDRTERPRGAAAGKSRRFAAGSASGEEPQA